jgi:hypothetical protein
VSSSEGRTAAAEKTVTTPATSTVGKVKNRKTGPESEEEKANRTAAKKAISPNDNTSSTGSILS